MSQDETAVNEPVDSQDTTTTDSAPVENKEPEVADPLLESLSNDDDTPAVEEPASEETKEEKVAEDEVQDDDTSTDTEAEQEQPRGKAEERKQQLNTEIRTLAAQKNALKAEIEALNSRVYQPQTVEELVEEGYSEAVAEVKALKQELELQQYNQKIVDAQTTLSEDAGKVIKDFSIFNPDSDDYQEDLATSAAEALRQSLVFDPNTGQIVGSHLTPYQIYKPIADAYEKSRVQGAIAGQKATTKMMASVDAQPSATPKQPKKDPLLEMLKSDD